MIGESKVYAITLVREQSKRLPNKHLLNCYHKPLSKWAVEAANRASYIDKVYVSTSSKKYQDEFKEWFCCIIDREPEYDADNLHTLEILKHEAAKLDPDDGDLIVYFDSTMPLTRFTHFNEAIVTMMLYDLKSCFTVKRQRYAIVGDPPTSSQERKDKYCYYGAVKVWTWDALRGASVNTWGESDKHIDLPICKDYEIDVNTKTDFAVAEALLKAGF